MGNSGFNYSGLFLGYARATATKTTTRSVSSYLSVKDKTTPTDVIVSPVNSTPFELNALTMLINVEAVPVMSPSLDSILRILPIATPDLSAKSVCDQFNIALALLTCEPVINCKSIVKNNTLAIDNNRNMIKIYMFLLFKLS